MQSQYERALRFNLSDAERSAMVEMLGLLKGLHSALHQAEGDPEIMIRRALHEQPSPAEREQEERHRRALAEKFQTASFAELCSITIANKPTESLYHCLNDIYGRSGYSEASASRKSSLSVDTTDLLSPHKVQKPIYEEYFPELFMY